MVNVYLSDEFTMKDMSNLIEKMKDTAVHEITHGGQSTDVLRKSGQSTNEGVPVWIDFSRRSASLLS